MSWRCCQINVLLPDSLGEPLRRRFSPAAGSPSAPGAPARVLSVFSVLVCCGWTVAVVTALEPNVERQKQSWRLCGGAQGRSLVLGATRFLGVDLSDLLLRTHPCSQPVMVMGNLCRAPISPCVLTGPETPPLCPARTPGTGHGRRTLGKVSTRAPEPAAIVLAERLLLLRRRRHPERTLVNFLL